jgi:hypothetical protein
MHIKFCDDGGETLYSMESTDLAGVIAAIKESDRIVFQHDSYKYSYSTLNHYIEAGKWFQEYIIYLKRA